MARKGGSRHLKRHAAPRAIKLPRKEKVWTVKPAPGPHPSSACIPLRLIVRDYLRLARNASEADKILAAGHVLVDGRQRRDPKFPVGLMDVVRLPAVNRSYRVLLDHLGRPILHGIEPKEASFKLCRVRGKAMVRGGKTQLTFHDGRTLIDDFGGCKVGDVLKLALPEPKVLERLPLSEGALALITGGKNVSKVGRVTKVGTAEEPGIVVLEEVASGSVLRAPKDYIFVIGMREPVISLPGAAA